MGDFYTLFVIWFMYLWCTQGWASSLFVHAWRPVESRLDFWLRTPEGGVLPEIGLMGLVSSCGFRVLDVIGGSSHVVMLNIPPRLDCRALVRAEYQSS